MTRQKALWGMILLMLVGILLVSSVSAFWYDNSFNLDSKAINDKSLELGKETTTKYGEYIIEKSEWYDPLKIWTKSEILRINLKNNTDYCTDCFGQGSVTIQKDTRIFKQPSWKRSFDDGENWVDWTGFTNWRLLIEENVDVFETQCVKGKEIIDEKNGTKYFEQKCSQVFKETIKQWNPYDYNKKYKADTYNWRIEGSKKSSTMLDWILETYEGDVKLSDWAVWG